MRDDGEPLGLATLEHVVPQAWFDRRAASALCMQIGDDADDPRNLALACARCNHHKGTGHDACDPCDARAREIGSLLATRLNRWRAPTDAPAH